MSGFSFRQCVGTYLEEVCVSCISDDRSNFTHCLDAKNTFECEVSLKSKPAGKIVGRDCIRLARVVMAYLITHAGFVVRERISPNSPSTASIRNISCQSISALASNLSRSPPSCHQRRKYRHALPAV